MPAIRFSDEEADYYLGNDRENVVLATAQSCEALAARFDCDAVSLQRT
jgi:hypothetical protein